LEYDFVCFEEVIRESEVNFMFERALGLVPIPIDFKTSEYALLVEVGPCLLGPVEVHHLLEQVLPGHSHVTRVLKLLLNGAGFVIPEILAHGVGCGHDLVPLAWMEQNFFHRAPMVECLEGLCTVIRVPIESMSTRKDNYSLIDVVGYNFAYISNFFIC